MPALKENCDRMLARQLETVVSYLADAAWRGIQVVNRRIPGGTFHAGMGAGAVAKSWERSSPVLGWPRTTDSLCPTCVRETRAQVLSGDGRRRGAGQGAGGRDQGPDPRARRQDHHRENLSAARHVHRHAGDQPGVPEADRALFPGATTPRSPTRLHNHGTSSIKYGRGSVLTVDLTNRCNMMCDPCFMDANQVGYVHELTLDEVKKILDDALTIKPRRQMTVQFSGGEPTISPIFLDAVAYARQVGYYSAQAATNGIRFAQDPEFAADGGQGRPADRLPAVRRHRRGSQRPPQGRQSVRREAARDREPRTAPASTSRSSSRSSTRSTTIRSAGSSSSPSRTATRSASSRSSRCRSPAATRISTTRRARRAALHAVAPGRGREDADRRDRAAARLVSALGRRRRLGRDRPDCTAPARIGAR